MFDNLKNNWKIVRADPRKWNDFNLKVVQVVLGVLTVLVVWQFAKVIIGFNTGNSTMNMVGRLLAFLFMCIIIYKGYNNGYIPLRDKMLHYKNMPVEKPVEQYSNSEIDNMIDETIKDLESKGGKK